MSKNSFSQNNKNRSLSTNKCEEYNQVTICIDKSRQTQTYNKQLQINGV